MDLNVNKKTFFVSSDRLFDDPFQSMYNAGYTITENGAYFDAFRNLKGMSLEYKDDAQLGLPLAILDYKVFIDCTDHQSNSLKHLINSIGEGVYYTDDPTAWLKTDLDHVDHFFVFYFTHKSENLRRLMSYCLTDKRFHALCADSFFDDGLEQNCLNLVKYVRHVQNSEMNPFMPKDFLAFKHRSLQPCHSTMVYRNYICCTIAAIQTRHNELELKMLEEILVFPGNTSTLRIDHNFKCMEQFVPKLNVCNRQPGVLYTFITSNDGKMSMRVKVDPSASILHLSTTQTTPIGIIRFVSEKTTIMSV